MPGLAVVATQLTTADTTDPYRLLVGSDDLMTGVGGVPIESLRWEMSGSNSPATMQFDHWDPPKAFDTDGHAEVRLWDQTAGEDAFGGYLIARQYNPAFATGRIVEMRATDWSLELDRNLVTGISYPAGLTDRAIIQGLCGNFLIGTLSYAAPYVASTNTNMPAMVFEMQSLRSAIEQVGAAADDDGLGERLLWVDPQRRINYVRAPKGVAAPYVIVDGVPSGGQKNVTDLELIYDDSDIVTAVFVKGGKPKGTGWVVNGAAVAQYGWRAEVLDVPDSKRPGNKLAYGNAYLRSRKAPVRRGSFSITGTTGWKADQLVTISSSAIGLAGATFDIKHVSVEVISGTPTLRHTIEFGARRPGRATLRNGGQPGGTIVHHIGTLPPSWG